MAKALFQVVRHVRTGHAVIRDVNRMAHIAAVLVRHGFGAFAASLGLGSDIALPKDSLPQDHHFEDTDKQRGELSWESRLRAALQDLGPLFVKLGQMLSTRTDVLSKKLCEELESLQDHVAAAPFAEVQGVLEACLGRPLEELFADMSPEPCASGSVAQVHRARRIDDGSIVAVKIQRPGIRDNIEADLEIMGFLARSMQNQFPDAMLFSPVEIVDAFERGLLLEMDFRHELHNLKQFQKNFSQSKHVRVAYPKPHADLSGQTVLTMDWIDGVKITDAGEELEPGTLHMHRRQWIQASVEALLQMIFVDGFFHGDLHPGNLLIAPLPRRTSETEQPKSQDAASLGVWILDCGLVGRLSQRHRDRLADILVGIAQGDFYGVARTLWRIGKHDAQSTQDYGQFESDAVAMLERGLVLRTVAGVGFGQFLGDLLHLALQHRVRIPADFTLTFKALVTLEGIAKRLAPDLDLVAMLQPHASKLLVDRYRPARLVEQVHASLRDLAETGRILPEVSQGILHHLRAGHVAVQVSSPDIAEGIATHGAQVRSVGWAQWAAASCLAGTLALDFPFWIWGRIPLLAWGLYGLSLLCGAGFVASGWRLRRRQQKLQAKAEAGSKGHAYYGSRRRRYGAL